MHAKRVSSRKGGGADEVPHGIQGTLEREAFEGMLARSATSNSPSYIASGVVVHVVSQIKFVF